MCNTSAPFCIRLLSGLKHYDQTTVYVFSIFCFHDFVMLQNVDTAIDRTVKRIDPAGVWKRRWISFDPDPDCEKWTEANWIELNVIFFQCVWWCGEALRCTLSLRCSLYCYVRLLFCSSREQLRASGGVVVLPRPRNRQQKSNQPLHACLHAWWL